ncbi:MAG: hypothetical protein WAU01_17740 [Saprospiraceae bacterium]
MIPLVFGLGGQELLVLFMIFFVLIIPIYFMIKILLSNNLPVNNKILWLVAIFVLSIIGLIVFLFSDDYKKMNGEFV